MSVVPMMGDRRNISIPVVKSWIADENFQIIIKHSYPFSKCCNVFLDDSKENSEALFDQFRSMYPYEYVLMPSSKRHECHGYFLVGLSQKEIARSIENVSWKSEILIVLNHISTNSSILDDSTYRLANVNVVSMSGTWKLTENYLKPRVFVKLNRYEEMRQHDDVNFHGRELQVSSIRQPPMTYFNRTIEKTIDGAQAEVYAMDTELDWDGIETRLFLIMAEKMNFTWTIRKPEGSYSYGKRMNDTVWKGGMIQLLHDRQVDMAFGSIWVTLDQNTFANLSIPWHQVYIHFLVPRPRRTTTFWALIRPFSVEVWCLFGFVLLLHSWYTCTRARIDPRFPKQFRNILITVIDLIGILLSSSVPKTIAGNRLQILLWRVAGWLIITAYCSSLAARLSTSEYESRIDTVEQFLEAGLLWGQSGQAPPFRDYFDATDSYSAQLPSRYRRIKNNSQLNELFGRGNYAILGKTIDTCFFPNDNVGNENLKNYRLMKQSVGHFHTAFAVQPWLLKPVNRAILWLKETGITIWHLRDVIRRRDSYNLREVLVEHDAYDGNAQILGLTPLGAGFSLLLVGSAIATIVFYLELKRAAKSGLCTRGHPEDPPETVLRRARERLRARRNSKQPLRML
ncbi:ionotropic receptor 21a [Xylocopa sonorina]|uniref:ionotropic receptor 21a n=1 Tax=Xylocopa sonorina TaxID=1818115 RepID=UPI00403B0D56